MNLPHPPFSTDLCNYRCHPLLYPVVKLAKLFASPFQTCIAGIENTIRPCKNDDKVGVLNYWHSYETQWGVLLSYSWETDRNAVEFLQMQSLICIKENPLPRQEINHNKFQKRRMVGRRHKGLIRNLKWEHAQFPTGRRAGRAMVGLHRELPDAAGDTYRPGANMSRGSSQECLDKPFSPSSKSFSKLKSWQRKPLCLILAKENFLLEAVK